MDRDLELKFEVPLGKFGVGGFEIGSAVAAVRLVDRSNRFVRSVVFLYQRVCLFVDDFKKGVVEVRFAVRKVVAGNGEQFLVGVREDVQPRFVRDFRAFITDVEEGGGGGMVNAGAVAHDAGRH